MDNRLEDLRQRIALSTCASEKQIVTELLEMDSISADRREAIVSNARTLVRDCRETQRSDVLDAFLLEFGLTNKEGVALMCLAESLLRVPDKSTADRLISDKLLSGDWGSHRGRSDSTFVNASTWGLILSGRIVRLDEETTAHPERWFRRLVSRLGESTVRSAVRNAMRIMGAHYVFARDIDQALARTKSYQAPGGGFSFDMLGEGARTREAARNYLEAYSDAIDRIGASGPTSDCRKSNGISVKLSALHPRYQFSQRAQVMAELLPVLRKLCRQAADYGIGLSIDAEEAARLELSMDLFHALTTDTELGEWKGLGFVLQAYQKRAPLVAQWLVALSQKCGQGFMVRLVKGAYWDYEIKRAQQMGLRDYPVFTQKMHTDLCYECCASLLLDGGEAIFPQFATHNAETVAFVQEAAGQRPYEFQRLHGMGEVLYRQLQQSTPGEAPAIRVYSPVGSHKDLLPYLVRRLLENGANSSFINRFMDRETPVEKLIRNIASTVKAGGGKQNKSIPLPVDLLRYGGENRDFSQGVDLDSRVETRRLLVTGNWQCRTGFVGGPIVRGKKIVREQRIVRSPANPEFIVGFQNLASAEDVELALRSASASFESWRDSGVHSRAAILNGCAARLQQNMEKLVWLISSEGGRTVGDAVSEVREAADFCRYYALQACSDRYRKESTNGCGIFLCISPWNFPLALFCGQIAAALATGNCVIAKPAEETSVVATLAVELFHKAGVPTDVLHLLPGDGETMGRILLPDHRIAGVAFTGSHATARQINRRLAERSDGPIPLIAETGGINCMIVDSTALPEQVVDDVMTSAFSSAGQRCSALRVLFLQDEIADRILQMLAGAMQTLEIGDPRMLSTDIGPVITRDAKSELDAHIKRMTRDATLIARATTLAESPVHNFIAPHVFEIPALKLLPEEVFGPILHVIRYKSSQLDSVLQDINDSGFRLTLGIQSRIDSFARYVFRQTKAGNTYINRNMIGAVVGVNPFGGSCLSGTGPKAGGPNYLRKFLRETTRRAELPAIARPDWKTESSSENHAKALLENSLAAELIWRDVPVENRCELLDQPVAVLQEPPLTLRWRALKEPALNSLGKPAPLPGPTGEENLLYLEARGPVLLIEAPECPVVDQWLAALTALISGCPVIVVTKDTNTGPAGILGALQSPDLPANIVQVSPLQETKALIRHVDLGGVIVSPAVRGSSDFRQLLASRQGAIIPVVTWPKNQHEVTFEYLHSFLVERTWTDNVVAKGGNAQLLTLEEF